MASVDNDDVKFKSALRDIDETIQAERGKLNQKQQQQQQQQQQSTTDTRQEHLTLNINIDTFSCNPDDDEFMSMLTKKVGTLLSQSLPTLTDDYREFILNFLFEYHYDRVKLHFNEDLTMNSVNAFLNDLQATHDSLDAFRGAWDGKLALVTEFIQKYPTFKDKPGPWGTTLLYSAAKNNRLAVVEYLITEAQCSVNAQNQQHLERALLNETIMALDYQVAPKAGSTALHGACFGGHLPIVKYLIEHGANYFIRNQAEETPMLNAELHYHIIQYFRNLLNLGYSREQDTLPETPIVQVNEQQIKDCIWEYMPFADKQWRRFESGQSNELNQSLAVKSGEQFKQEIQLSISQTISMVQFLQSGNQYAELAWIRCRGSSIFNFDCYALWQLFFIKWPKGKYDLDNPMSIEILNLSMADDRTSEIQLDTWYNCDAKTNALLDDSMSNRRKRISMCVSCLTDDPLDFDLMKFTFANQRSTISGFIRWIPKLISNNEQNKHRIVNIDSLQTLTNLEPIPLTTKRLKEVSQLTKSDPLNQKQIFDDNDDDKDCELLNNLNQDDDSYENGDQFKKTNKQVGNHSVSLDTMITGDDVQAPVTTDIAEHDAEVNEDDYLNDNQANEKTSEQLSRMETVASSTDSEELKQKLAALEDENGKLKEFLDIERLKIQTDHSMHDDIKQQYQQELDNAKKRIDALNIQKVEKEREWTNVKAQIDETYQQATQNEEQKLSAVLEQVTQLTDKLEASEKREVTMKETGKMIQTIAYTNTPKQAMQDFLLPKFDFFVDHLKTSVQNIDEHFVDQVPKVNFGERNGTYSITVYGFPEHHTIFKATLQRVLKLSNSKNSAIEFYQRHLNRILRSMNRTLIEVGISAHSWRQYCQTFNELLQEKSTGYVDRFNDYIKEKSKSLIEQSILGASTPPWIELRQHTNDFLQEHSLMDEIEGLKHQTLEEFIKQNISLQRLKIDKIPTEKSVHTVKTFIDQIKITLRTNPDYKGHLVEHFKLIPGLLQQIMIYYSCFTVQLPLFESSRELLDTIEANTVTTITTSTGSGKSTLIPALLIADGYDKVFVTQPRRLPCTSISERVNATIEADTNSSSPELAGWAVSGEEHNPNAKILYLTDGLLKERLLYDENFIGAHINVKKSIVFFIDEVHERSVNIDLCLASLARLLTIKSMVKSKMKLIISSATLDLSVPQLFREMPNINFAKFQVPHIDMLYPVTKIARPKENILDIVQELYKKHQRHDQILCFVNSVTEVHQCCRLLNDLSRGTIIAFPLIQSQSATLQQSHIEHGTVFFSTTVAETSLTFPSLKYVIDTGMVNIPMYDPESKRTVLQQVRASESTIKQRLGRLGRTRPGEYYYLYDFRVEDKPYATPHMLLSDLTNIEFSLRRSPIKNGLHYMRQFLPDKPTSKAINATVEDLRQLDILEAAPSDQFTEHGESLAELPDFGSLAMSKAVLAALTKYDSGRDLICLSSILSVLNTTAVLKDIPQSMKSEHGDFMTLLNIMNEVLLVKQSVRTDQFNLPRVCQAKGLTSVQHILRQAMRRYSNLEKSFHRSVVYRQKAQIRSGCWELVAKSLLAGYSDNVFVSMKELQERIHRFARYKDTTDIAILDLQSTLTGPISQAPVCVVLARDVRYSSAVRSTAVISFVGEIKPSWVKNELQRHFEASVEEKRILNSRNIFSLIRSKFSDIINIFSNNSPVSIHGTTGSVLSAELILRKNMVTTKKFDLENKYQPGTTDHKNLSRNLESITKMAYIFQPMQWRWEAQKQVKITVNNNPAKKTCEITVEGRDSENENVKKEFDSFLSWLRRCVVIRHPNSGVLPRLLRPQMRKKYPEIEKKISRITDIDRTMIDLYKCVKSANATRESRMEAVAWIAVCEFGCKLEGGFVRDWIIGDTATRPPNLLGNPKAWIERRPIAYGKSIPSIIKGVVPSDLDCHLPLNKYFDIDKFRDKLHKFDMICEEVRENWRYVLLIDVDAPTGPFTMDLIEPHVALTHDRIDLDVSNLSLERNYPREIGMRIDITQSPYLIELETIVENIKNKRFQVLRPIDEFVQERIDKMIQRQWTQVGDSLTVVPQLPPKCYAILVPIPSSSTLYQSLETAMKIISSSVQIVSIEEIKNPNLEDTYEAMKKMIAKECPGSNPNERKLFHGTSGDGIDGILQGGFDDRLFKKGAWGNGAYFADDPRKSHNYTKAEAHNHARVMYYNKVVLGKESVKPQADNTLVSAPPDYHSVRGTQFTYCEYIVYRYGQAMPYLKITYTT